MDDLRHAWRSILAMPLLATVVSVVWLAGGVQLLRTTVQKPIDLAVFLAVPVLLLLVAAVASWIPAQRAGRIDPVAALRGE